MKRQSDQFPPDIAEEDQDSVEEEEVKEEEEKTDFFPRGWSEVIMSDPPGTFRADRFDRMTQNFGKTDSYDDFYSETMYV